MSQQAYNNELQVIIEEKRLEWSKNLKDIAPLLRTKNTQDMSDAQALLLSYRVMIMDEINYFIVELTQLQKQLKQYKAEKFILYTTGLKSDGTRPDPSVLRNPIIGNQKVTGPQKDMIISGDLSEYEMTASILENIINYLRECIETVDKAMYSIKNRIELFGIFK